MTAIEFFDRAYSAHTRYWQYPIQRGDADSPWRVLLRSLATRRPGRALDLGAGEGLDAIRLARLGYDVEAVDGSSVAAEKIQRFAREAHLRVKVVHADVTVFKPSGLYDVAICSGVLHYLLPAQQAELVARVKAVTTPSGWNLVTMFTDHTPVPDCHRIVSVFPDRENGFVSAAYGDWITGRFVERAKPECAHTDFPPHEHSFIKVLSRKPPAELE